MQRRVLGLAATFLTVALPAFAQTNPTGTISGRVFDQQGSAMPGVLVQAESPALQGKRVATTSANGDYVLPFLPAGEYTVTFELGGFTTVKQTVRVAPSATVPLQATMPMSAVSETLTVVGEAPGEFSTHGALVSTNIKQEMVDKLPLGRTLRGAAVLAPAVQETGPSNNLVISGANSFENIYMINGVVAQDNIRNTPFNLFIEDALQETTISTAAISAEFGRFGGGVVSGITKSGGNAFSGSFRTTFENDKWIALTPFPNDKRVSALIPTYEATLGGPIFKDKLWFFGAGRYRNFQETLTTFQTAINYPHETRERRYEGKLTWAITAKHTVKGAYTKITNQELGNTFQTVMDLASTVNRQLPQDLLSANYTGILNPNFFVEAQYSSRHFTFEGSGSLFQDPVKGTMLQDRSRASARYNSPQFCGVCTPENRDNQDIIVKGTYFLSTSKTGSHNIVAGVDVFDDKRFANNNQTGSGYTLQGTSAIIRGTEIFPVFSPVTTFILWNPIFVETQGNRFRTISGFVNDAWTLSKRWRFNVGMRYDKNDGTDATGNPAVKDSAFSPRLSVSFDPWADGVWTTNASYSQYVAGIANSIADGGSAGGRPASFSYEYQGPPINAGNPANPVSSEQAITSLFAWFNANGGTNRPTRTAPSVPGVNTQVGDGLKSPNVREVTLGFARRLGHRGAVRLDGVHRDYRDFYTQRVDLSTGKTSDQFGRRFDLRINENDDTLVRTYKALTMQADYRILEGLNLGANYTLSELKGNFQGENAGSGPINSGIKFYPEYFDPAWSFPVGDLLADNRHKLRIWATWDAPIPPALGHLTLGALQYYSSGGAYNASGLVDTRPYVTNPGYETPPGSVDYFFEPRDQYRTADLWRLDLSLNWSRRIGVKNAEVFLRGVLLNAFNYDELIDVQRIDTTIQTNNTTATLLRFNPFTQTPVEGVHWRKGPAFGTALTRFAYGTPRTFNFSVGFRF